MMVFHTGRYSDYTDVYFILGAIATILTDVYFILGAIATTP